jgi:diguanylate cyclase (GGDEF)-like protein
MIKSPPSSASITTTREVVELLYANLFTGLVMTILSISAITFGFANPEIASYKFSLWAGMIFLTLLRTFDGAYWYLRLRNSNYPPRWPLMRFVLGSTLSGLVWAFFCVSLYESMSLIELSTTMVIVAAMAGGAATTLASHLPLVLLYTTLVLLPLSVRALFDSDEQFILLGGLGTMFWVAMCSAAVKANDFTKQAIAIKHENEELVTLMRQERNEVRRVNQALLDSNQKLDHANSNLESEVNRRTKELQDISNRDPLTNLMNRIGFMQNFNAILERATNGKTSMAVLFIDLDGFKQINDSLGHQAGDVVLSKVAGKLSEYCEANCIGRWGGDEFIIILPHADGDTAVAIALAIKSSLTTLNPIANSPLSLDATIGIALYPVHGDSASTLVQLADLTMYHYKRTSPGLVGIYTEALYDKMHHEQQLREGLRQAIEKKQLQVVYQPIIDATSNRLWAIEALLRWQFNGVWISPDEFIPLAEKSGAIHDIGTWVLHRACIDAAQWDDQTFGVSVNVSVLQLVSEDFIACVDRALASSGLAPQRLHLEVTESIFADDMAVLTTNISALKARRVKVAIDDFGTGFSSLNLLQSLDFDLLKIDRAFVQQMTLSSDAIVKATVLMAKALGCKTVAEGVETEEQASLLRLLGVDCLQGYLFARPLEKKALQEWYTGWQDNK